MKSLFCEGGALLVARCCLCCLLASHLILLSQAHATEDLGAVLMLVYGSMALFRSPWSMGRGYNEATHDTWVPHSFVSLYQM